MPQSKARYMRPPCRFLLAVGMYAYCSSFGFYRADVDVWDGICIYTINLVS